MTVFLLLAHSMYKGKGYAVMNERKAGARNFVE